VSLILPFNPDCQQYRHSCSQACTTFCGLHASKARLRCHCQPQLIQYAKHKGIKTINLVRRQEQVQQLKDLG
jgi:hypothetical protein